MKTFLVANHKGGIGKTTTSRHVIWGGAHVRSLRTLAVDFCLQGNLSKTFLAAAERNGFLSAEGSDRDQALENSQLFSEQPLIPIKCDNNIDLIPASSSLASSEDTDLNSMVEFVKSRLASVEHNYDLCVIDTSPTVTKLLIVALAVGDFAVSPCEPDEDSIDGLLGFFSNVNTVTQEGGLNEKLVSLGVLINKVKRDRSQQLGLIKQMREAWGENVLELEIPDRAAISAAKDRPVWITERGLQSKNVAAREVLMVCDLIFKKLGFDSNEK